MKILTENFKEKLEAILLKEKEILIVGHYNPDGDCIGASLALYNLLKSQDFNVSVLMPSELPDFLKHLSSADDIIIFDETKHISKIKNADIIFYVDFNDESRTENTATYLKNTEAVKVILDHHPEPNENTDLIFSDTEMSSASEVVYHFIHLLGFEKYIDKDIAACIFTGIMTDTLNFSVNSSRPETFRIVADLLSYGIDKDEIYDKVNNNFSEKRLRLVGYSVYKKMKIYADINFACILISKEELEIFDFKPGDHEGIVNMPLSVSGINISLFAIEKDDFIKISLRSKGNFDVNRLSGKYFNGGGHKNAAGGKIYKSFNEAESYILNSVKKFFI